MPIKINGYALPIKDIVTIGLAIFWMASLSFQVKANGDDIEKQASTKERLVRIEERQVVFKEDIKEIKDSQKETQDTLVKILIAVNKDE
jgi:hypothetical protein